VFFYIQVKGTDQEVNQGKDGSTASKKIVKIWALSWWKLHGGVGPKIKLDGRRLLGLSTHAWLQ